MKPAGVRSRIVWACCLALTGCASSGRWDPYRARHIRPATFPPQYRAPQSGCRLAQAEPPAGREPLPPPSCPPGINAQGRAPLPEDWKRLAEYDLTRQLLESARRDTIDEIAARVDDELAACEQHAEALERGGLSGRDLDRTRAFLADRKATFTDRIAKLDDALALTEREQDNYRQAMADAVRGERIVWHSSPLFTGWLPDRYATSQRGREAEPAWRAGIHLSNRYAAMRAQGTPPPDAILAVAVMAPVDLSGMTNVVEAMAGSELFTGRRIPGSERFLKGVLGVVALGSLAAAGGPRVGPFAQVQRGTHAALVQATGALAREFPLVLVAQSGSALAITRSEALVLAQAGILQMAAIGAGGGPTRAPVPGLKGEYAKTRGGGSKEARAYQKKVTGRDDSVIVNGVEFDGWRGPETLLDAKHAKGKGSWYDVTGTDNFTLRVKIPEILKQAKRQQAAMKGSGAKRIEWVVSNQFIAETLGPFFQKANVEITVIYLAP